MVGRSSRAFLLALQTGWVTEQIVGASAPSGHVADRRWHHFLANSEDFVDDLASDKFTPLPGVHEYEAAPSTIGTKPVAASVRSAGVAARVDVDDAHEVSSAIDELATAAEAAEAVVSTLTGAPKSSKAAEPVASRSKAKSPLPAAMPPLPAVPKSAKFQSSPQAAAAIATPTSAHSAATAADPVTPPAVATSAKSKAAPQALDVLVARPASAHKAPTVANPASSSATAAGANERNAGVLGPPAHPTLPWLPKQSTPQAPKASNTSTSVSAAIVLKSQNTSKLVGMMPGQEMASTGLTTDMQVCAPTTDMLQPLKLNTQFQGQQDPAFRFFLFDEGPFNMDDTVQCLMDDLGASIDKDDLDFRILPNMAEHIVDLWLLKQLRAHPQRTMDRSQATLFIMGAPLSVSYMAPTISARCSTQDDHSRRTRAVKEALEISPEFNRCNGCDFVFAISTPKWRRVMGPTLHHWLIKDDKRIIFATADKDYHKTESGQSFGVLPPTWQVMVIPYKAHFMVEQADLTRQPVDNPRDVSFTFHGTALRRNEGRERPNLLGIAERLPGASIHDSDFSSFDSAAAFLDVSRDTAETYLRSSFCLVPVGDTPTSRRLFDALAAGCVPIVIGSFDGLLRNLPFVGSVDWGNIAIFAGSLECVTADETQAEAWLQALTAPRNQVAVEGMRERGRAEFARALTYATNAVADQLLLEASRLTLDQLPQML